MPAVIQQEMKYAIKLEAPQIADLFCQLTADEQAAFFRQVATRFEEGHGHAERISVALNTQGNEAARVLVLSMAALPHDEWRAQCH